MPPLLLKSFWSRVGAMLPPCPCHRPARRRPHRASRRGSAGGKRRRPRQHPRRRGAAQHCAQARRGERRPVQPRRVAHGGRPSPDRGAGAEPDRPAALTAASRPPDRARHGTAPAAGRRGRGREGAAPLKRSPLAARRSLPRPPARGKAVEAGLKGHGPAPRWAVAVGDLAGGGAEGRGLPRGLRQPVGPWGCAATHGAGVSARVLYLCYRDVVISMCMYISNVYFTIRFPVYRFMCAYAHAYTRLPCIRTRANHVFVIYSHICGR